jgi:hypothetical protein
MPNYRRIHAAGGTFFFTVVTNERLPIFSNDPSVKLIQQVLESTRSRYPFDQNESPARGRVLSAQLQGCFAKTGANDDLHWLWFGMVG